MLRRELSVRDLTLFSIGSIIGTRWIASAAHAGPGSISIWLLAGLFFSIPLALSVATLSARYAGSGGLYVWVREEFGPLPGFLAFWLYWVSIACWFPGAALFYMSAGLYSVSPDLARNRWLVLSCALAAVWAPLLTNLIGLRVGKWTQNIGAVSCWALSVLLICFAAAVWMRHGSATGFGALIPPLRGESVRRWAEITYALSGMELVGMMRDEIHDPERAIPKAAAFATGFTTLFYAATTTAMLVLLRPEAISELNGLAQAGSRAAGEFSMEWIRYAVGALVLLSAIGQFGGIGTAVSRMPVAAGVDHLLPEAFARIHPRWSTPHVAILTLGCLSSAMLLLAQIGSTLQAAYETIVSLMVLGGFLPYCGLFAAAWRCGRRISATLGLIVTLVAIAFAMVPGDGVSSVALFQARLALGSAVFIASGVLVYCSRRRR